MPPKPAAKMLGAYVYPNTYHWPLWEINLQNDAPHFVSLKILNTTEKNFSDLNVYLFQNELVVLWVS